MQRSPPLREPPFERTPGNFGGDGGVGQLPVDALNDIALLIGKDRARLRYFKAAVIVTFWYVLLLFGFSFASRRNNLRVGQTQCFGNWCTTVQKAFFEDKRVFITLRLGSLTKGGEVRPVNPRLQVIDSKGNAFGLSKTSRCHSICRCSLPEP